MVSTAALRRILPTLPRVALHGPWYRAVHDDHVRSAPPGSPVRSPAQPLWPGGAARHGARFTPRALPAGLAAGVSATAGIDCLYLAEDELTPLIEVAGVLRPRPGTGLWFEPQVMMTVDGLVADVLDLTDGATQQALGTTYQELTGPWRLQQSIHLAGSGPRPATQALGEAVYQSGRVVALRYPSAKHPRGVGLVVFTARLRVNRDALRVFNHTGGRLQQSLP
jgi:hypothetical protein